MKPSTELKRIVSDFLNTMTTNGIKKISALTLLYEEMNRQLEIREQHKSIPYEELAAVSDKLAKPIDLTIIDLPPMLVLSSWDKKGNISDLEGFWEWVMLHELPPGLPGRHEMFECQSNSQSVMIIKVNDDFNSPYVNYVFDGGLFAAGSIYVDEDLGKFHTAIIQSFDTNKYYEVDYLHDGTLRHESLVETVISIDDQREKVDIFIPVKKRVPDASHYDPNELIESITAQEIKCQSDIKKYHSVERNNADT